MIKTDKISENQISREAECLSSDKYFFARQFPNTLSESGKVK